MTGTNELPSCGTRRNMFQKNDVVRGARTNEELLKRERVANATDWPSESLMSNCASPKPSNVDAPPRSGYRCHITLRIP